MDKLKKYLYSKGENAEVDADFEKGILKGKVKLGNCHIFWKKGLRWYVIEIALIGRVYRRVEEVKSKLCCGSANFDIQKLVLDLKDGSQLQVLISEGDWKAAESLYQLLQENHPGLQLGKPEKVEAKADGCCCNCEE